ncbi:hypothetical protein [Pseudoroseomonas ludipueritiae]|uniref:SMODS and SLOG-associating 2TM effector domain-containing protein n=1 Tax=Pseudoroseomonas ludipueritiae TaxID=198093 RepID=A0ABR7R7V4_9PROT|nr:hypothetical protein [Pseudoroseomonas ludipueritiae]MBC9177880.1 hypothetical protein [Pseudoroseomonas ludipueritiae]
MQQHAAFDRKELLPYLQAMYKEHCDQARQHENLRQQGTTLVMTICGAILSLAAASGGLIVFLKPTASEPHVPAWSYLLYSFLGVLIVGLSRHGRLLSIKHYERNKMHAERARQYRLLLEAMFPDEFGDGARRAAVAEHQGRIINKKTEVYKNGLPKRTEAAWQKSDAGRKYPHMVDVQLYSLWAGLFRFMTFVGVFLILCPILVIFVIYWDEISKAISV